MRKVWRFALQPVGLNEHELEEDQSVEQQVRQGQLCEIEIPAGAELLPTIQISSKGLTMYAIVDPDADTESKTFFVCGNGVELPEDIGSLNYRGTYKVPGSLTAHVFETVAVPKAA